MVRQPYFKNGVKKGQWSLEEDAKLRAFLEEHGQKNWSHVPKLAGLTRCGKSCRLRWENYLKPGLKHGNFTKYEEDLIIELQAQFENKWSYIATKLPGRTDHAIKNHWHGHLKKRIKTHEQSPPETNSSGSCIITRPDEEVCPIEALFVQNPESIDANNLVGLHGQNILAQASMKNNSSDYLTPFADEQLIINDPIFCSQDLSESSTSSGIILTSCVGSESEQSFSPETNFGIGTDDLHQKEDHGIYLSAASLIRRDRDILSWGEACQAGFHQVNLDSPIPFSYKHPCYGVGPQDFGMPDTESNCFGNSWISTYFPVESQQHLISFSPETNDSLSWGIIAAHHDRQRYQTDGFSFAKSPQIIDVIGNNTVLCQVDSLADPEELIHHAALCQNSNIHNDEFSCFGGPSLFGITTLAQSKESFIFGSLGENALYNAVNW